MSKGRIKFLINGKQIPYTVTNAADYFMIHDQISLKEIDSFIENNHDLYKIVSEIIGLKISCFLLWHTTNVCQSLHDSLVDLKKSLIKELKTDFGYIFDEAWLENGLRK